MRSIGESFIFRMGSLRGRISACLGFIKIVNLVLDVFRESLFALNHSEMFSSSEFSIENSVLMFFPDKNRFVSSAKRMNFKT